MYCVSRFINVTDVIFTSWWLSKKYLFLALKMLSKIVADNVVTFSLLFFRENKT